MFIALMSCISCSSDDDKFEAEEFQNIETNDNNIEDENTNNIKAHNTILRSDDNVEYSTVNNANPLKGFAVWEGSVKNGVPCSLEYVPVAFSDVLTAENTCNFSKFESKLNAAQKRGHQAIVRFIIDDTGKGLNLPNFLINSVKMYNYTTGSYSGKSPDYNDQRLLSQILYFIKELAAKYDGDARIANLETGIIGHYAEQHIYYCEVNKNGQKINDNTWKTFFKTFSESFSKTCISVRSPSRPGVADYDNLGYYNDMLYSDNDDNYFRKMLSTNSSLPGHWVNSMITGEFAPPEGKSFIENCGNKEVLAKYKSRVEEFHVSSLLFNKAFTLQQDPQLILAASDMLGYSFTATSASLQSLGSELVVAVTIKNTGVAPFYYKWPVSIAFAKDNAAFNSLETDWDITSIAPGESVDFSFTIPYDETLVDLPILIGIPNPMKGGYYVSFANKGQDKDVKGWLTVL